jgi:hypothetical protein
MELIPIFAFIVLVASIATFIFSLVAYILFKVREKRGKYVTNPHPKAFKAELVAPNYYYLADNESSDLGNNKALSQSREMKISNVESKENNDLKIIDKSNGNELVWR